MQNRVIPFMGKWGHFWYDPERCWKEASADVSQDSTCVGYCENLTPRIEAFRRKVRQRTSPCVRRSPSKFGSTGSGPYEPSMATESDSSSTSGLTLTSSEMESPDPSCRSRRPMTERTRDASRVPAIQSGGVADAMYGLDSSVASVGERPSPSDKGSEVKSHVAKQPAHVLQRQEKAALADQARELEKQLNELRRRVGLPTREDKLAVDRVRAHSADIDQRTHVNALYLGRLDSMITNELLSPPVNTLSTFIHLPQDMEQRRAILRGMQELKLRRGIEVATEWLHHLDHTLPYLDEKGFTIASGEYHYYRFEIDQFPNYQNARQLYNTFVQYRYNMEISITEGLGQLTLREDLDDVDDPTIWNHRFVTITGEVGVPEELNLVCFAQFYPHSPYTNSPMGIVVVDTVNIDDLYPYVPEERTCKDVQNVHIAFEVRDPVTNETVVIFKQLRFCVQLPPKFEVAPGVVEKLQQNFSKWPNYSVKYLHEYIVTEPT